MVQGNTYQQPRLYIGDKEIMAALSGSIRFPGNNQLNSLNVKINLTEIQNMALHNKTIELYLNDGSYDSVPIFRGFINDYTPSETSITINATDMRSKLTGKKGLKLTLTDENNYDGYTLGQFILSYVKEFINDDNIGTDLLKDTSPPVFMTNERGEDINVYDLITKKVKEAIDVDTSIIEPLEHFIDVYEDGNNSSIVIKKHKKINSTPTMTFSYADGIKNLTYKRRLPANTVTYQGRKFAYTNTPKGISSIDVKKQNSPAETRNLALQNILISQQETDEISLNVSKGYNIRIGEIVNLDIDDEDVSGHHRVQGKTISFGDKLNCSLKLNKLPPILKDFI